MKHLLHKTRLQYLIEHRNIYLFFAVGMFVSNILLCIFLFLTLGKERIVIVPPDVQKSFWISSNKVSPEYLSEMTLFLNSLHMNVTPDNANFQHGLLLRYIHPDYYGEAKTKLLEMEDKIKKQRVSISFQPSNVRVDANKLIVEVVGNLQYTIGNQTLPKREVKLKWRFSYAYGLLRIIAFPEVKNDA